MIFTYVIAVTLSSHYCHVTSTLNSLCVTHPNRFSNFNSNPTHFLYIHGNQVWFIPSNPSLSQVAYTMEIQSEIPPSFHTTTTPLENQNHEHEEPPPHHVIELRDSTPSVPLVLSFTNLTYTVNQRGTIKIRGLSHGINRLASTIETFDNDTSGSAGTKTILHNISSEARNGELLAVLGPSGSGKSTLIDALANRTTGWKGSVTLNGEAVGGSLMRTISSYVMQDDLLHPMLTVEETLMFSAEFRLPRWLSKAKKRERVEALIDQLGLRRAAKTVIGDESHRGVSGGERRRVSIGIDIIHDPIILFLDEPTSSLDSSSALMVIQVLKKIASTGSIVILSIHQPSYRILTLLDRLIILSRGRTIYSGPPTSLPVFLSEFGRSVPENESYVEFALDLARDLEPSPKEIKKLVEFSSFWQSKHLSTTIRENQFQIGLKETLSASISRGKLASHNPEGDSKGNPLLATFANPSHAEIKVLAHRSLTNMIRKPSIFMTQLCLITITGFFLAALYWNVESSPKGVQERLGFFAFVFTFTFFISSDALPALLIERDIFNRETSHNAYRHSSYVITTTLLSIPQSLLLSLALSIVTYPTVGLAGAVVGFFYLCLSIFSSLWAGTAFVSFVSVVISNALVGHTVVLGSLAFFLLVSGFFVSRDKIPDYLIWFHYVSAIKYPYEGMLQSEFRGSKECFSRGLQVLDNTPLKDMNSTTKEKLFGFFRREEGIHISDSTCMTTGLDVLRDQGITQMGKWECLCMALAWGLFFRVLFYWALRMVSKNKRH